MTNTLIRVQRLVMPMRMLPVLITIMLLTCPGLAQEQHERGERLVRIFDGRIIHWVKDRPDVEEPDGTVLRDEGQTVERVADLPDPPLSQRQAMRIVATVRVEPIYSQEDGRRRPCDPWTRLGCVSVMVPDEEGGESREMELLRFTTGYGSPCQFEQDITVFAPHLHGRQTFHSYLSTYSPKPGWKLSLTLRYSDEGVGQRRPTFARHLFNEPLVTAQTPTIATDVTIPEGLDLPRVRVISTGHATGGGLTANEFVTCTHVLRIDGQEIARWRPWSERGGPMRPVNPTAGRQVVDGRTLWASDFDRSGWNPGLIVEPLLIPTPELTAGRHRIELEILGIQEALPPDEGGKVHHGYWAVSAAVVADEPWPMPEEAGSEDQ